MAQQAERGWVYGEFGAWWRIGRRAGMTLDRLRRLGGDRPSDKLCDGWLPKKAGLNVLFKKTKEPND